VWELGEPVSTAKEFAQKLADLAFKKGDKKDDDFFIAFVKLVLQAPFQKWACLFIKYCRLTDSCYRWMKEQLKPADMMEVTIAICNLFVHARYPGQDAVAIRIRNIAYCWVAFTSSKIDYLSITDQKVGEARRACDVLKQKEDALVGRPISLKASSSNLAAWKEWLGNITKGHVSYVSLHMFAEDPTSVKLSDLQRRDLNQLYSDLLDQLRDDLIHLKSEFYNCQSYHPQKVERTGSSRDSSPRQSPISTPLSSQATTPHQSPVPSPGSSRSSTPLQSPATSHAQSPTAPTHRRGRAKQSKLAAGHSPLAATASSPTAPPPRVRPSSKQASSVTPASVCSALRKVLHTYWQLWRLLYSDVWRQHLLEIQTTTGEVDSADTSLLDASRKAIHSYYSMRRLSEISLSIVQRLDKAYAKPSIFSLSSIVVNHNAQFRVDYVMFQGEAPWETLPIDKSRRPKRLEVEQFAKPGTLVREDVRRAFNLCYDWIDFSRARFQLDEFAEADRDKEEGFFSMLYDVLEQEALALPPPGQKGCRAPGQRAKAARALLRGKADLADAIHCEAQLMGILTSFEDNKTYTTAEKMISPRILTKLCPFFPGVRTITYGWRGRSHTFN
jgi:hypothetical protein